MIIATMPFIRYHRLVASYLMGLSDKPPKADKRWKHAAAYVEPEMDHRRGYCTNAERVEREEQLFSDLYKTKSQIKKAMSMIGPRYEPVKTP